MQILHFGSGAESEGRSTQLAYWKQQLDAAPSAGIAHRLRPAVQTFRGARETLILPNPDGALKSLSQQEGNLVHAVAGSVQDAALPLYRAG